MEEVALAPAARHPSLTTRALLTVEDTFAIKGRGLVLAPSIPASEARARPVAVELHRPDGSILSATALAQIPFIHPTPTELKVHLLLLDVAKDDVPVGTIIWSP